MVSEAYTKRSRTSFHTKLHKSAYSHRNLKTHSVPLNRPRKLIEAYRMNKTHAFCEQTETKHFIKRNDTRKFTKARIRTET